MAETPASRKQALVAAIVEARTDDAAVVFEWAGSDDTARVGYEDRTLRLRVDDDGRTRLKALLDGYHVFKIQQPETRKADAGVVYLSAVTDAKHAADFVEALFREVYGAPDGYELQRQHRNDSFS